MTQGGMNHVRRAGYETATWVAITSITYAAQVTAGEWRGYVSEKS